MDNVFHPISSWFRACLGCNDAGSLLVWLGTCQRDAVIMKFHRLPSSAMNIITTVGVLFLVYANLLLNVHNSNTCVK